jgi:orotidine-5'-phosphate decarboxylase
MEKESKLIVALDIYDGNTALGLVKLLREEAFAFKLNWPIIMGNGSVIIHEISKYAPVLCDFKLADIPNTNKLVTRKAREEGAWGIISHIFNGRDSFAAVVEEANPHMKVFSVSIMSHPGFSDFMKPRFREMIESSVSLGASGIIVPGNNYDLIREARKIAGNKLLVATGIGAQKGRADLSIEAGADYVIVGRSIYESRDPLKAAMDINASMNRL